MKFIYLPLISLIFLSMIKSSLYQSEGFLPKTEPDQQSTEEPQQQTTFERVVNFDKFTLELTTKNKTYIQKIQLIPMQSTNIGSVFFNTKNNTKNQRGWKISLNKGQGYDLQNINKAQMQILKKIFQKNIGTLQIKNNKITKILLHQPQENNYCSFEVSQLKHSCWRIDVYPKHSKKDAYKYVAHLKMCAVAPEGQKKFKRFTYLLNNKQLIKSNSNE